MANEEFKKTLAEAVNVLDGIKINEQEFKIERILVEQGIIRVELICVHEYSERSAI